MGAGFATVTDRDGVLTTSAAVDALVVTELRFPPGYVEVGFEPGLPYLAIVLDGSLEKSFQRQTVALERECTLTMPAGKVHDTRFGRGGARVLTVRPRSASDPVAMHLDRWLVLRRPELGWLGARLAGELRARDDLAPLAAEGFALELLAATSREAHAERNRVPPPAWLHAAEGVLRATTSDGLRLSGVAAAVGVHPTHLARVFRAHHGVSVGEYARRLRVAWAAKEVARGDTPLAVIARQAGFADQSHFTRVFRRCVGTTPARYRERVRSSPTRSRDT